MVHTVARLVAERGSTTARALDVGCGLGQITVRLASLQLELSAIDVSVNAVRRAAERISIRAGQSARAISLLAGSAAELPFATESFDVVVASDGLFSWDLSAGNRALALAELRRVLRDSGRIIFTEHTRYHRFAELITEIRDAGFEIEQLEYLYDRPWYQFESWTRALQSLSIVKAMRRNVALAQMIQSVGRVGGRRASRHICVVAR